MLHRVALKVFGLLPSKVRRKVVRFVTPTFTAGTQAVLLNEAGELLVVQTSYNKYWALPGGLLGKGEQPHEAAVRETLEETGLHITLTDPPRTTFNPRLRHMNFAYFAEILATGPAEPVAHPPEIIHVGWYNLDHLPLLDPETVISLEEMGVLSPGQAQAFPRD